MPTTRSQSQNSGAQLTFAGLIVEDARVRAVETTETETETNNEPTETESPPAAPEPTTAQVRPPPARRQARPRPRRHPLLSPVPEEKDGDISSPESVAEDGADKETSDDDELRKLRSKVLLLEAVKNELELKVETLNQLNEKLHQLNEKLQAQVDYLTQQNNDSSSGQRRGGERRGGDNRVDDVGEESKDDPEPSPSPEWASTPDDSSGQRRVPRVITGGWNSDPPSSGSEDDNDNEGRGGEEESKDYTPDDSSGQQRVTRVITGGWDSDPSPGSEDDNDNVASQVGQVEERKDEDYLEDRVRHEPEVRHGQGGVEEFKDYHPDPSPEWASTPDDSCEQRRGSDVDGLEALLRELLILTVKDGGGR